MNRAFQYTALCQHLYPKNYKKYSRRNIWSVLQCNGHPLVLYLIVLYECKFTHIPGRNPGKLGVVLWRHTPVILTLWRQKLKDCQRFQGYLARPWLKKQIKSIIYNNQVAFHWIYSLAIQGNPVPQASTGSCVHEHITTQTHDVICHLCWWSFSSSSATEVKCTAGLRVFCPPWIKSR